MKLVMNSIHMKFVKNDENKNDNNEINNDE